MFDMWRSAIKPECMFIDCGREKGCLIVDLLTCLEECGLDTLGLLVSGSIVEGISAVERVGIVICGGVFGFER